jgi:hypothetical protein
MAATKSTKSCSPVADTTSEVPASALRLYGRNPRKGNVAAVAASLKAHGQYRPVVANIGTHTGRRFEVLAGNHTVKAFRELATRHPDDERWNAIKVHWVDVDEDQAARIVLSDNRTAELGRYDNAALAEMLHDVSHDLEGLGYTAEDLDALVPFTETEIDPEALADAEDDTPINNRGQTVIAYSLVFTTIEDKKVWLGFLDWLKRRYPDFTPAERVTTYIGTLVGADG